MKEEQTVVNGVQRMYTGHPFPNTSIVNTAWAYPHREYLAEKGIFRDGGNGLAILEGGCGTGEKLVAHAHMFPKARLSALDLTPASIDVARFHVKAFGATNVDRIKQANLMGPLPFEPESFDVVYSIGVIHHTPDPALAMTQLARLVKPGGRLFFWVYGAPGQLWRIKHLDYVARMRKGLGEEDVERMVRDSFREARPGFHLADRIKSLFTMKGIDYTLLLRSLLVAIRRKKTFNFVGLDDSNLYDWFLHYHEKFYTGEEVVDETRRAGLFIEDFIAPRLTLKPWVNRMTGLLAGQWDKLTPFERLQAVDALAMPSGYWWVCRKEETAFSKSVPRVFEHTLKLVRGS